MRWHIYQYFFIKTPSLGRLPSKTKFPNLAMRYGYLPPDANLVFQYYGVYYYYYYYYQYHYYCYYHYHYYCYYYVITIIISLLLLLSSLLLFLLLSKLFILFYLILFSSVWHVYFPRTFFIVLVSNLHHFTFTLFIQASFLSLWFTHIIMVIIILVLFLSILLVSGGEFNKRNLAAWFTPPTHWLFSVSSKVRFKFVFFKMLVGAHHQVVDGLFYIYQITSFNYDTKAARDLSDSQILSSE